MKTISISKKKSESKSSVVHIDPQVHKKLKIYCAANEIKNLGEYASQIIAKSLNKKGEKS